MIRYLSFDLQGVLSASAFSDYFWLEQLPRLYAKKHQLSLREAKTVLGARFKAMGKYDLRYYDDAYWAEQLGFVTLEVLQAMPVQPVLNKALLGHIRTISLPKIILSTTTTTFLDYELGSKRQLFEQIFSCVDTFHVGGKTPQVFQDVARALGVRPDEIIHIGDNPEMDIQNATTAGLHTIPYTGSTSEVIKQLGRLLAKE